MPHTHLVQPPRFRLVTFGGLALLTHEGRTLSAIPRGRLAILAVIASEPTRGVSRDVLLARFWPDSDEERARASLRQAMYAIRQALGSPEVTLGTTELRLSPGVVSADVAEFVEAIRDGRDRDAVALHTGPFLHGVHLTGNAGFDEWVERERARHRSARDDATERLAERSARAGAFNESARWWQERADADPLNGRVACALMRALDHAGERDRAVRFGRTHLALVRQEVGASAGREVAEVLERISTTKPSSGVVPNGVPTGAGPAAADSRAGVRTGEAAVTDLPAPPPIPATRRARRSWPAWRIVGGVGMMCTIALFAVRGVHGGERDAAGSLRALVRIAPLENRTGDRTLDPVGTMAVDWISRGLEQTGMVDLEAGPNAGGDSSDGVVTPSSVRRSLASLITWPLGGRSGRPAIAVSGSYYRSGDSVIVAITLQSTDGAWRESLEPVHLAPRAALPGVEVIRQRVLGTIATRTNPLMQHWASFARKPANFEAYERFAGGLELFFEQRKESADSAFLAAYRLDSSFVSPLLWALFDENGVMTYERRESILSMLAARRESLAPLDRAMLDMQSALAHGQRQEAFTAARRMVSLSPRSEWTYMLAYTAMGVGRPAVAAEALERIDPRTGWLQHWPDYYTARADAHHALHAFARELEDWHLRSVQFLGHAELPASWAGTENGFRGIRPRAALGLAAGVDSILDALTSRGDAYQRWQTSASFIAAIREMRAHGHAGLAPDVWHRYRSWISSAPESARQSCELNAYLINGYWQMREYAAALTVADRYRALCPSREAVRTYIVALGFAGKSGAADSLLIEQRRTIPSTGADSAYERARLDYAEAQLAAFSGRLDDAVRLLGNAMDLIGDFWTPPEPSEEPGFERLRGYPPYERLMHTPR